MTMRNETPSIEGLLRDAHLYLEEGDLQGLKGIGGMLVLKTNATDDVFPFPSLSLVRTTAEWEHAFNAFKTAMTENLVNGYSLELANQSILDGWLERLQRDCVQESDLTGFLDEFLVAGMVNLWACLDARRSMEGLPLMEEEADEKIDALLFEDVYRNGGAYLAAQITNYFLHNRMHLVTALNESRKSKKPRSKAARKKASKKARRNAR